MINWLLVLAIQFTGYPPPAHFPVLVREDRAWFQRVCGGMPRCAARAVTEGNVIHLDAGMDLENDPVAQALVLHEIVHVLQNHRLGPPQGCMEHRRREREAYLAQALYLAIKGRVKGANIGAVLKGYGCNG